MPLVDILSTLIVVVILVWAINTYVPAPGTIRNAANVVLGLLIVGMVLWLINSYVPMAGSIKAILNIVVVLATIVQVLRAFGLWGRVVAMWNDLKMRRTTAHAEAPAEPREPQQSRTPPPATPTPTSSSTQLVVKS